MLIGFREIIRCGICVNDQPLKCMIYSYHKRCMNVHIHSSTRIRKSKLKYRSRRFYKILKLLPLKAVYGNIARTKWLWRSWMGFRLFWSSCSWLLIHKILLEVSWTLCLFYFTVYNTKLRNLDVKAVWKETTLTERNCTRIKRFTQFLILNSTITSVLLSSPFSAFGLEFTIALSVE